jgi:hypothetical protein
MPVKLFVALAALVAATSRGPLAVGGTTAPPACIAPEYHQFDFFLGDWDTFNVGDAKTVVARNKVTRMVDGCAVREVYVETTGLRGESFSTYDTGRLVWHQSWVTNRGQLLLLEGGLQSGRMVITANERLPDGNAALLRGTWWSEPPAVREKAERSRDGVKTWTPVFDIVFRPHAKRP